MYFLFGYSQRSPTIPSEGVPRVSVLGVISVRGPVRGFRCGGPAAGRGVRAAGPRAVAHVPLAQVGRPGGRRGFREQRRGGAARGLPARVRRGGHHERRRRGRRFVARAGRRGLAVHLHVFPQRAGVRVGLVAAPHLAVVRLVAGVDVGVLLAVAAVGEPSVAPVKLTFEGLLACVSGRKGDTLDVLK